MQVDRFLWVLRCLIKKVFIKSQVQLAQLLPLQAALQPTSTLTLNVLTFIVVTVFDPCPVLAALSAFLTKG